MGIIQVELFSFSLSLSFSFSATNEISQREMDEREIATDETKTFLLSNSWLTPGPEGSG